MLIAGADISEFGAAASAGPDLNQVLRDMEACEKPVIAAINGTAFGGGLEVALCCDYRIAAPTAPVGLPEVKLGLLPGAGGTQRLPRLIGAEASVQAIISGDPIMSPDALTMGIIDRIGSGDIVEDAIAYAAEIIEAGAAAGAFAISKTRSSRTGATMPCLKSLKRTWVVPIVASLRPRRS